MIERLKEIQPVHSELYEKVQDRLDALTKPQGSLGRLEDFAMKLVGITGRFMPEIDKKVIFTFAGDHGVVAEGVSAFPQEVTRQMVCNFLSGGAGVNVLAKHAGADNAVVDVGVNFDFDGLDGLVDKKVIFGTKNMLKGPAMSRSEAEKTILVGIEIADEYAKKGYNMFGAGDMGIGNTTPSSAIAAVMTAKTAAEVTGRGTGIDDEALNAKVKVIQKAIEVNRPAPADPLDVLAKIGGAEIGAIAGLCIGAAINRVPVVVDGLIATAGAIIAYGLDPRVRDYMFAGHCSVEPGHMAMLDTMGLKPIVDLGLRLGEGTGAALGMLIIEAGLKIYKEMATFNDAGVSSETD